MGSTKSKHKRCDSSFSPKKLLASRKSSEIFESFLVGICTSGFQRSNSSINWIIDETSPPSPPPPSSVPPHPLPPPSPPSREDSGQRGLAENEQLSPHVFESSLGSNPDSSFEKDKNEVFGEYMVEKSEKNKEKTSIKYRPLT